MGAPTINWVYDKARVSEKDKKALETAKKLEKKDIKHGYKWFKINNITKILVECDKHGNPTKKGQEHIDRIKAMF